MSALPKCFDAISGNIDPDHYTDLADGYRGYRKAGRTIAEAKAAIADDAAQILGELRAERDGILGVEPRVEEKPTGPVLADTKRAAPPSTPKTAPRPTGPVRTALSKAIGGKRLTQLEDSGLLEIVPSVEALPTTGVFSVAAPPSDVAGVWDGERIWLVEDNIQPGTALGVLLHEGGEHAGMEAMLGESYGALQSSFDKLVEQQDPAALAALERVPEDTPAEFAQSERLAYFIEEAASAENLSDGAKSLLRRLLAAIRAWFRATGLGQAMARSGVDWRLTDEYAVALATRALRYAQTQRQQGPQASVLAKPPAQSVRLSRRAPVPASQPATALDSARAKINPKTGWTDKIANVAESPKEFAADAWDRIEQGVFDKFHGLLMAEKSAEVTDKNQSAYVAARLSTSLQDVLAVLLRHGRLKWDGNILQPIAGTKGFLEILNPVAANIDEFGMYLVGVRASDLMQQPRHAGKSPQAVTGFTTPEINAMLNLGTPTMEKVRKEYIAMNKSVLDIAEGAGLISKESRRVWESDAYLPFYRIMEEGGVAIGPKQKQGLSHQQSGIRRLKGSDKAIGDPIENIIKNWTHLLDASLKNNALAQAVENLEGSGLIKKAPPAFKPRMIPAEQAKQKVVEIAQAQGMDPNIWDSLSSSQTLEGLARMFSIEAPADKNVVRVMRNGKPEHFQVYDDLLLRSLTSINQQQWGRMMSVFRAPKRWLTTMVTADPAFMARNFTRDVLSAWVLGRDSFIPLIDAAKGAATAWNETPGMVELMAAGGTFTSGGYLNAHDPTAVSRFISAELENKDFQKTVLSTPKKLWDFWQRIGAASENANRVAVAMGAKKAGKTTLESAFESKDLMDFSMRGDFAVIQFLSEAVPFLSARLQGLHRLGRGAAENPLAFALKGSMITAAALALYALNQDDERWKELEEWDRDTYFHFFVGDDHYRLPKPFEVGVLFGTIPERMADAMSGNRGWDVFLKQLHWNMKETLALSPVPQVAAPILEQWANKSKFTGRPIVGMRLERLAEEAQYEPWTSETMRALGETVGWSPKRMEAALKGYFGAMGGYALGAADMVTRNLMGYAGPPAKMPADYPVLRSFYRHEEPRNTRYATEMYDLLKELNTAHYAVLEYRKQGDDEKALQFQKEYRGKMRYRPMLMKTQRALSDMNRQIRYTHLNKGLSPETKRQRIEKFISRKNDLTKRAMDFVDRNQ